MLPPLLPAIGTASFTRGRVRRASPKLCGSKLLVRPSLSPGERRDAIHRQPSLERRADAGFHANRLREQPTSQQQGYTIENVGNSKT
jgi:hypothetical protein